MSHLGLSSGDGFDFVYIQYHRLELDLDASSGCAGDFVAFPIHDWLQKSAAESEAHRSEQITSD